ncbi:MAG: NB-ARC domain-containing protein, partial [Elainella sp.]
MDIEATLAFTDRLVFEKAGAHLSDLQLAMLRSSWSWERQSYDQIAETYGYSSTYLKHDVGPKLWKLLSEVLGEKVNKTSFRAAIERRFQAASTQTPDQQSPDQQSPNQQILDQQPLNQQDWGDAVDVRFFYGRTDELDQLCRWICDEHCRLIAILGLGGMGKTSLSVKLAQQLQPQFAWVVWRSLRNAPALAELLVDLIQVISNQTIDHSDATISRLLQELRARRCLIVLDNVETILQNGSYRSGYEQYSELFRQIGETNHPSCLVLTSREKPDEVGILEGHLLPVRSLMLRGLNRAAGQELLQAKGTFRGTEAEWQRLIAGYSGNPLALKMISTTIQSLFAGELADFLSQDAWALGNVRTLIQQQFQRLSEAEKTVISWLAIDREPVAFADLKAALFPPLPPQQLIEILESLEQRCLVEKSTIWGTRFSLQPVIMEYVTDGLVEQVAQEIQAGSPQTLRRLKTHALLQPQANDDRREAQIRLILRPILATLQAQHVGEIDSLLTALLAHLQGKPAAEVGYAGGNLLNLLCQLRPRLENQDFSDLTIWQADLRQVILDRVNLANSDLSRSAFAETLGVVFAVAFSPDGATLATGDAEGGLRLWQTATAEPLLNLAGHRGWVWALAFSPNGELLASCSSDKTVQIWQVETGDCLQVLRHSSAIWALAFSVDGQTLASGSNAPTIQLWRVGTGGCERELSGHTGRILSLAFSPDGRHLASGSDDQTVRIWDVQTGKCQQVCRDHRERIWAVAFSPDGQLLASGSADQTIRLWSRQGECLQVLTGHRDRLRSLAFSPDAQQLISSSDDQTIRVWQVETGQCLQTLKGHSNSVFAIALNPDQILASGSTDHTVKLWSLNTGRCLKTLTGYTNSVFSVAFSPNGQLLASGSTDRSVRLWSIEPESCLKTLRGHQDWVTSVAFHPNGEWLASSSLDRSVRLWSAKTGHCLQQLQGHKNWVQCVAFSPDGQL